MLNYQRVDQELVQLAQKLVEHLKDNTLGRFQEMSWMMLKAWRKCTF